MHRRNVLTGALSGIGGLIAGAVRVSAATTGAAPASPDKSKVVYHLSDLDKVSFVLGNIRNHFDGMDGPDKVTAQKVTLKDLLPGFIAADRGGVVRIAELQSMGYVYLRP
jgi:intracellular sulfur oxidation DsrE/DsrF family protein